MQIHPSGTVMNPGKLGDKDIMPAITQTVWHKKINELPSMINFL
jgi:hypothetical protein